MKDKDNHDDFEAQIKLAQERFNLELDYLRYISPEEMLWLLDHCPFLQVVNPNAVSEDTKAVEIIRAESGWPIHDYGDAISSSPGPLIFGGGFFRISSDEDDEGGGIVNPGKGTLIKQSFDTAFTIAEMAARRGWLTINIIDGHPRMERALWIRAEQLGLTVEGFEPDERDEKVRDLIEKSDAEIEQIRKEIQPKP